MRCGSVAVISVCSVLYLLGGTIGGAIGGAIGGTDLFVVVGGGGGGGVVVSKPGSL